MLKAHRHSVVVCVRVLSVCTCVSLVLSALVSLTYPCLYSTYQGVLSLLLCVHIYVCFACVFLVCSGYISVCLSVRLCAL